MKPCDLIFYFLKFQSWICYFWKLYIGFNLLQAKNEIFRKRIDQLVKVQAVIAGDKVIFSFSQFSFSIVKFDLVSIEVCITHFFEGFIGSTKILLLTLVENFIKKKIKSLLQILLSISLKISLSFYSTISRNFGIKRKCIYDCVQQHCDINTDH